MKEKTVTPEIQRFIELDQRKEEVKKYFEELAKATKAVVDQIGINSYFQDPVSRTVYKIVVPQGRFVNYEPYSYLRTKKEGETRGTLSMKEAKENGFEV